MSAMPTQTQPTVVIDEKRGPVTPTTTRTPDPAGGVSSRAQILKDYMRILNPPDNRPQWIKDVESISQGLQKGMEGVAKGIRLARGEDMAGDRLGEYLQQMRSRDEADREASERSFMRTLILADLFGRQDGLGSPAKPETAPTPAKPVPPKEQKISYISPAYDLYADVNLGLDRNMVEAFGPFASRAFYDSRQA